VTKIYKGLYFQVIDAIIMCIILGIYQPDRQCRGNSGSGKVGKGDRSDDGNGDDWIDFNIDYNHLKFNIIYHF